MQTVPSSLESLEDARVKHKVEYFDRGTGPEVWDDIHARLQQPAGLDSTLSRARLEDALRDAAMFLPEGMDLLKIERKRDLADPEVKGSVKRVTKKDIMAGHMPAESDFEVFEAGVISWAPSWSQACWTFEVTLSQAHVNVETDRLAHEQCLRDDRLHQLEKGLDDDLKAKILKQCELERGHSNGPQPGARNDIYIRDVTLSEVQLTIPSLIKAFSIHFEHEAIRPAPVGQLVPKE